MKATAKVDTRRLQRDLRRLASKANDDQLGIALMAGAQLIANAARSNAPVDTGTLRRSISVSDWFRNGATVAVQIGTNLAYARRIEFGFVGRDSLGRQYNQTPQPYLRPAFNEQLGAAKLAIREALKRLLAL